MCERQWYMSLNEITWNGCVCSHSFLAFTIIITYKLQDGSHFLPEHWEFVDNWWLGLFAGNAIQTSAGKDCGFCILKWFFCVCFLFLFYNEAGVFGCAEKLPSGSLAMTVVLRSTPPFLSSNTGERSLHYMTTNHKQNDDNDDDMIIKIFEKYKYKYK